jgi:hypothetical protein
MKFLQLPFLQKSILRYRREYTVVKLPTEDTGKIVLHLYHKMAVSPCYILYKPWHQPQRLISQEIWYHQRKAIFGYDLWPSKMVVNKH